VAYRGGERGLEPLPLLYDLRNKCGRMHQNVVFSTKNAKNFLGRVYSPPGHSPSGEGDTPLHAHPLGACGTSTPPIVKFWVRHWYIM